MAKPYRQRLDGSGKDTRRCVTLSAHVTRLKYLMSLFPARTATEHIRRLDYEFSTQPGMQCTKANLNVTREGLAILAAIDPTGVRPLLVAPWPRAAKKKKP